MIKKEFEFSGKKIIGFYEVVAGKVWVHVNKKTFIFEKENKKKKSSLGDASENEIIAPMPGKIISIKKNIGEAVKAGDKVVIMEAMKMEYALKASKDSKVKKINCKAGDQVALNSILVEFE